MNTNFDLNIDNYNIKELEEIFELSDNYDEALIELKETKLRENIIKNKSINSIVKSNTLFFISKVKVNLISNMKNKELPNMNSLAKTYETVYNLDKSLHESEIITENSSNIIKKPDTPFGNSYPSEFYQGILNPLTKRTLRQNINIDTRFRENYYSTQASNFHLDLPIKLTQVVSLQLSALEMLTTFYNISKIMGNNFFVIELNGESLLINIPDGNYSYISLQGYVNTFLASNPNFASIQFLTDANTPIGIGDSGSGRSVIGSLTGDVEFSVNFQTDKYGNSDTQTPLPLKLGWILGFREGYYKNNTTYVSEGIVDLLGSKYIYLVVNDFNNSVNDGFYGAFTSSILNKNILARISLRGNLFHVFNSDNYNLITTPRQYFGPVDIQKLQIQLLDEYGRILDLNNMDYSFCLTFQTIYNL